MFFFFVIQVRTDMCAHMEATPLETHSLYPQFYQPNKGSRRGRGVVDL